MQKITIGLQYTLQWNQHQYNYKKPMSTYNTSTGINRNKPLKSTSPFPSVSNISMTRCTSGFCCNSGRDINSSTLREPELSRSSFLNRFPSLLISSASTERERDVEKSENKSFQNKTQTMHTFLFLFPQLQPYIHLQNFNLICLQGLSES